MKINKRHRGGNYILHNIPRKLDWTPAMIGLARIARPLSVSAVTIVTLWIHFFLEA
jgi:hypothetical protein